MKYLKLSPVLLILVGILLTDCQSNLESQTGDLETQIDSVFHEYINLDKPGAAVAVVKDGDIVFQKGYGSANLEYNIPVTSSTIFHIASISKQFTVFSILLLADEGELNFDDDIRSYIPEVPDFGKTITLRHLASHTSGLRDQWNLLAMAGWRLDDVITKEQILKLVSKQKELNSEPGDEFIYCNTGFTLLAEVVSRVSGKSFAEFTKSRIFDPLGMSNTLFYDDHEKIVKNRAYSYSYDAGVYKKSVLSYANVGATSLFTTVNDICLWALNFESPKVGTNKINEEMSTLATLNNGKTFGGAYGQFIDEYKGLKLIQHDGSDAGYRSYFGRYPDQKFAIAVFSNNGMANPNGLAFQLADLYLKDQQIVENNNQKSESSSIVLTSRELEEFSGNYWTGNSSTWEVYVRNDTLRYSSGENQESSLIPVSENTFQMLNASYDLKVRFESENGQKKMVLSFDDKDVAFFEFYLPVNYSRQELEQFTGVFYSDELSTAYTIVLKDDALVATHPRHSDIAISPVKTDVLLGNQWFFGRINVERNTSNSVTGIRVSSGRVRNLYFEKIESLPIKNGY